MPRFLILLVLSVLLFSCGKNTDDKTADAILSANIALGKGDCQSAITILEDNGRVNTNSFYLKTLASAYACRAGYSTLTFFTSDLSKTASHLPFGGLATYSTSSASVLTTLQADQNFKDLQTAMNILLYAGGIDSTTEPTSAERSKYFNSTELSEINSQLLYMNLVQLGRYLYYYGNSTGTTGTKGSGTAGNSCFSSYVNAHANVKAILTAAAGTCTNTTTVAASHAQLSSAITAATRKTRLCHGVVLLNNVFTLFPTVVASIYSNQADRDQVLSSINLISLAKDALIAADSTTRVAATTLSQAICEDDSNVSVSNIESYFAGLMEGVFL